MAKNSVAMQILEKLPFVDIDLKTKQLQVMGGTNFVITINGKKNLFLSEANQYVARLLQGDKMKQVELITSPQGQYSDKTAVINIVTKGSLPDGIVGNIMIDFGKDFIKPNLGVTSKIGKLVYNVNYQPGYTYYSENFDWIAVYGGADCVGLGSQNGAKNIYSTGDALQKFGEAGLQDYNPVGKTMYACAGYFKMGATDKQTGIILPALKIGRKKASNVELTFETCPNIGGSGKADAVTVTVEIVEGPGTVNGNSDRESEAMKPDQTWKWTPMSVKLYGVTAATRIAIRSTQQGNPGVTAGEKGYFRWYLDNVKIVKAPRN